MRKKGIFFRVDNFCFLRSVQRSGIGIVGVVDFLQIFRNEFSSLRIIFENFKFMTRHEFFFEKNGCETSAHNTDLVISLIPMFRFLFLCVLFVAAFATPPIPQFPKSWYSPQYVGTISLATMTGCFARRAPHVHAHYTSVFWYSSGVEITPGGSISLKGAIYFQQDGGFLRSAYLSSDGGTSTFGDYDVCFCVSQTSCCQFNCFTIYCIYLYVYRPIFIFFFLSVDISLSLTLSLPLYRPRLVSFCF
jgi:hypothetical protein